MKATTLFALTIALVLGLGAAATAKYFGLLDAKAKELPPATVVKEPPLMILVAGTNLFKGHALSAADVKVREARPDEKADYDSNKKDYLPAVVNAANYRIMAEHIEADKPLKAKYFEPQEFDNLEKRIGAYMRAVHLDVPKVRCSGGLLQRDDHVDVLLTTNVAIGSIGGAPETTPVLQTACIARDCRIVSKRNTLLTALIPNPDEVPFTLEANPYRASLIFFAEQKGLITLVPRSKAKSEGMPTPAGTRPTFSDDTSEEYKDEDERVQKVENLEYTVSDKDLTRIFKLAPIPTKTPPAPPTRIVTIKGTDSATDQLFGADGRPLPVEKDPVGRPANPTVVQADSRIYEPKTYMFVKPEEASKSDGPNSISKLDNKSMSKGNMLPPATPTHVDAPINNPNLKKKN